MTEPADATQPSRVAGLRALGVTPQREVEALLKDQLIPEAVLEQLVEKYSTVPTPEEGARVHRTLAGGYENCHTHSCELIFHFPDVTPEQIEFVPLEILMPMLEISQPPSTDLRDDPQQLSLLHQLHSMSSMYNPGRYEPADEAVVSWRKTFGKSRPDRRSLNHRDYDLPAVIRESGNIEWWQAGRLHRLGDKPAVVKPDGSQSWYWCGQRHREDDKPAVVNADGSMEWWFKDKLTRRGGPARILAGGREEWYEAGWRHRVGAPAVTGHGGFEGWYQNGQQHRDEGPAIIDTVANTASWYIHGKAVRPWYGRARWQFLRLWRPVYTPLAASACGRAVTSAFSAVKRAIPAVWQFIRHPLRAG